MLGRPLDQAELDGFLTECIPSFGRNLCHALSLAFHEALRASGVRWAAADAGPAGPPPRLCLNVINGGRHAYTNPVLSDFPEYLLVARADDLEEVVAQHADIQRAVRDALRPLPKTMVSGNEVSCFGVADNRACLEFLCALLDRLGLGAAFDLMVDASAGDLWEVDGYRLPLTDGRSYDCEAFVAYWLDLLGQYPLRFLEDPFAETDEASWGALSAARGDCLTIGDNLYASDAERIRAGAAAGLTQGVILKPNQAGTVTALYAAFEATIGSGQVAIASHRSVSTESTFVAEAACRLGARFIKIGPLYTDYSSVLRLNEIVRLTSPAGSGS